MSGDPTATIEIKTVADFLQLNLTIPNYQRPYKWSVKHASQLLQDIKYFRNQGKQQYRLGSVVLYKSTDKNKDEIEIVDGQQRFITILLLLKAKREADFVKLLGTAVEKFKFKSYISQDNIVKNYNFFKEADVDEDDIGFLLDKCEFSVFTLGKISEAFQFFDSQNARGKDLAPHDLLKAYHLREFPSGEEQEKKEVVKQWEKIEQPQLESLFNNYLYRLKQWKEDKTAFSFTKKEINLFKGVNVERDRNLAFASLLFYARAGKNVVSIFPYSTTEILHSIEWPMVNGKYFFELVAYYQKLRETILKWVDKENNENNENSGLNPESKQLLQCLEDYSGHKRTGDYYVREMFYACLLYYYDKFKMQDIDRAIRQYVRWAYFLRLSLKSVRKESVQSYAIGKHYLAEINPFELIKNALKPGDALNFTIKFSKQMVKIEISELCKLLGITEECSNV